MAVCIAVIGKENSPKYVSCLHSENELQFHYKVHTALDVVEEKLSLAGKSNSDARELYLGLLHSTEEHKIFGYVTNTKIKFVVIVEAANTTLRDNEVRTMFEDYMLLTLMLFAIHSTFLVTILSLSLKFELVVKSIMSGNS